MKKQIILTVSAIALIVGSIFAYSKSSESKPVAQDCSKQCPTACCEDTGGQCDPSTCDYNSECKGK